MGRALDEVLTERGLVPGAAPTSSTTAGPADITAPAVPIQEEPDIYEASARLRSTARETFAPGDPAGAASRAAAFTEAVEGRPAPIRADPELFTLADQARRTFRPQGLVKDERAPILEQVGEQLEDRAVLGSRALGVAKDATLAGAELGATIGTEAASRALMFMGADEGRVQEATRKVRDALGINTAHPNGNAEAAAKGDITVDEDLEGAATENTALAALRIGGTLASSLIQETVGRVPVPQAYAKQALGLGQDPSGDGWDVSEVLTGAPRYAAQGGQQRVRRDNPAADWAQGVMERIETGRGLEGDLALAAKNRLGPEYERYGWWTGLLLDMATNWEGAILKPAAVAGRVSRAAAELDAAEGLRGVSMPHVWEAIKGNEVDAMEEIGGRLADELAAGRMTVDQLPPYWRARVDQVAMAEHEKTFRELLEEDDLVQGAPTGRDEEFAAGVADAEAARAESAAVRAARQTAAAAVEPVPAVGASSPGGPAPAPEAPKGKAPKAPATSDQVRKKLDKAIEDRDDYAKLVKATTSRLEKLRAEAAPDAKKIREEEEGLKLETKALARAEEKVGKLTQKWNDAPAPAPKPPRPSQPKPEGTPGVDPGVFEPRPEAEIRGPREKIRPSLPVFSQNGKPVRIWNQADFIRAVTNEYKKPDVHPLGYDITRGEGFRRMEDSATQAVDDVKYAVRNKAGDVIGEETTFAKALEKVMRRQLDGDSIWYDGSRRRVGQWGTKRGAGKDEPVFSADPWFASDVERAMVRQLRETDPRAIPARLRQLMADRAARRAKRAAKGVGAKILELTTAAPPKTPVAAGGRAADVIRKTARLAALDLVGSDVLKQLPTGALVSPREHAEILAGAQRWLGMSTDQAEALIKAGGELPPEQLAKYRTLLPKLERLTPTTYTALQRAAVREVGGYLADVRNRVQGMLPLGEALIREFSDLHLQRWATGSWKRRLQDLIPTPLQWMGKGFTGDALARMPESVRNLFRGLESRLANTARDLEEAVRHEIKSGRRGDSAESVLKKIIGRYPVVRSDDLDLAETVASQPLALVKTGPLDALRERWIGDRPEWLDSPDDIIAVAGVRAWARDARASASDIGRDWIHANAIAAGVKAGAGTDIATQIARLTEEELLPVYREVMYRGVLDGPETSKLATRLGFAPAKTTDSLVAFAMRIMQRDAIADMVDELIQQGGVVRVNDTRTPALRAALEGTARSWDGKRWTYRYTEAQTAWAEARLRDWGIEPGAGNALRNVRLGEHTVQAPDFLVDELESIARSGALQGTKLEGVSVGALSSKLMRHFKESVTHGLLVPHPSYFLGQIMGLLPTLVNTRGWKGAVDTVTTPLFRYPALVGELGRRLGGASLPLARIRDPGAYVLRTADGTLLGLEELEEVARRFNLGETKTAFETQAGVGELLRAMDRSPWDPRRLAKPAKWWQETLRRYAGAVDLNARLGTYVDLVQKGTDPARAALMAKESVLDFGTLTRFERNYMRLGITFYAFLRKNADAHVKALLTNPARVMSQMRLAHASLTNSGLTNLELGGMRDSDVGRFALFNDEEVADDNGRVHPLYRLNRVTSPPVSVADWLMQMRMLFSPLSGSEEGLQDLGAATIPPLQMAIIRLTGRRLDREIDSANANRIPPALMDLPTSDWMRDAFGIGPEVLTTTDDSALADADATLEMGGLPARWVAGAATAYGGDPADAGALKAWQEEKRRLWQMSMLWVSRDVLQFQQTMEATGFRPPPPYMTQSEAARDLLLGLKTRPVLAESEVGRRFRAERERRLNAAATELRLPEGRGPR